MRFLSRTPVRTFILYPIITALWEFMINGRILELYPFYAPLMVWGYLQYHLCGRWGCERAAFHARKEAKRGQAIFWKTKKILLKNPPFILREPQDERRSG